MDVRNEGRKVLQADRNLLRRMAREFSSIVDRSDAGVTCSGKSLALSRAPYASWGGEGGIEGKSEKGGIL